MVSFPSLLFARTHICTGTQSSDVQKRTCRDDEQPFLRRRHPRASETGILFASRPRKSRSKQYSVILEESRRDIAQLSAPTEMRTRSFRTKPNASPWSPKQKEEEERSRGERGVNKDVKMTQWVAKTDGMGVKTKQRQRREKG